MNSCCQRDKGNTKHLTVLAVLKFPGRAAIGAAVNPSRNPIVSQSDVRGWLTSLGGLMSAD